MDAALTGDTDMDAVTTYPTVDEGSLRRRSLAGRGSARSRSSTTSGSNRSTKTHAGREQVNSDSSDFDDASRDNRGGTRKAAKRGKRQSPALGRTAKPAADDDDSTEEEEALKKFRAADTRKKQSSALVRSSSLKTDRVCVAAGHDKQGEPCKLTGIVRRVMGRTESTKIVKLWLCCETSSGKKMRPSVTSGNKPELLQVPLWSVLHVYDELIFDGGYKSPRINGEISDKERADVVKAYEEFNFDQFQQSDSE